MHVGSSVKTKGGKHTCPTCQREFWSDDSFARHLLYANCDSGKSPQGDKPPRAKR